MEFLNPYELDCLVQWFNNHNFTQAGSIVPVYLKEFQPSMPYRLNHPFKNEESFYLNQYLQYGIMPSIDILEFMYNHMLVINLFGANNTKKFHIMSMVYNVTLQLAKESYFPRSQELRTMYYQFITTKQTCYTREMFEVFKRHGILDLEWYDEQRFNNDRLVVKDPLGLENAFIPYSKRIPDDIAYEA